MLTSLGKLTQEEQSLLDTLSDASIFEARSLLDQNYTFLKSIFIELPTFDIYQDEIKKRKDGLNNKRDEESSKQMEKQITKQITKQMKLNFLIRKTELQ